MAAIEKTAAVPLAEQEQERAAGPAPNVAQMLAASQTLQVALRRLPDDVDMIEHNPDEGQRFFCCGAETHLNLGKMEHARDCWYVAVRDARDAAAKVTW